MTQKYTPVHEALDPNVIYERGFVTREESEAVEMGKFGSKVQLYDPDGDGEGIWVAFISQEDRALYDGNTNGETLRAVLLNHAVCFFPNPTWGRVITGKTKGSNRPHFKSEDQVERLKKTHDAYLDEYPPPPEEETKK